MHKICREQLSRDHGVVLVCGAGVTMSQYPDEGGWSALLKAGVAYAASHGKANAKIQSDVQTMLTLLAKADITPDDLLTVGQLLTETLTEGGLLGTWLRDAIDLKFINADGALLKTLARCGKLDRVRFATTNYDFLLERAMGWTHGVPLDLGFSWYDVEEAIQWQRGERRGIYHLHGHARQTESIVLGKRSYSNVQEDPWVESLRTAMAICDTVIFVGCGLTLQDPAFREILEGTVAQVQQKNRDRLWFQLVLDDEEVGHHLLAALPYGKNYAELPSFIESRMIPWLKRESGRESPDWHDGITSPPKDSDAGRIDRTRESILSYIGINKFQGISGLDFSESGGGLPRALNAIFLAAPTLNRVAIADQCIHGILVFAQEVVKQIGSSRRRIPKERKAAIRACLINAMQRAILLSATTDDAAADRDGIAFNGSESCELELASWLSVSILLRKEVAASLTAEHSDGMRTVFHDDQQGHSESRHVEMGTFEKMADGAGKKSQARKIVKRMLYPNSSELSNHPSVQELELLKGETSLRRSAGKALLFTVQKDGGFSPTFIKFLNEELHVGVVTITARDGVFQLNEGHWRARLAALYETLEEFEEKK